jgi:hypothetical protein
MLSDPEKGSSLFLFGVALAVLLGATKLGLGAVGNPGPGFLPFLAAGVLVFCSGIYFLSRVVLTVQRSHDPLTRPWAGTQWRKVIYVVLTLIAYSIFFEDVGFIACTFFLMMFLLRVMEVKHWYTVLIGGVLITFVSYMTFEKLLMIGFPRGILGF